MEPKIKKADSFDKLVESELKERKNNLLKKFSIGKDKITADDILTIMEKMKLSTDDKEAAQIIFNDIDVNLLGEIKTEDFIEQLANMKYIDEKNEKVKQFYTLVNEHLISKRQRIIEKLKFIKTKAFAEKDSQCLDDIDWIISSLCEEDLYEPEIVDINKQIDPDIKLENELDYLAKYSQIENVKMKESDIFAINKAKSTMSIKTSQNFFGTEKDFYEKRGSTFKRRNNRLSTFISPSILGKVLTHLSSLDSFDFDIFELNNLALNKTSFYIAYEIFTRKKYLEGGLIDEDCCKNFIDEIVEGYNKDNAYHNDLHGADVMQTTFVMIEQGDLQGVKLKINLIF